MIYKLHYQILVFTTHEVILKSYMETMILNYQCQRRLETDGLFSVSNIQDYFECIIKNESYLLIIDKCKYTQKKKDNHI